MNDLRAELGGIDPDAPLSGAPVPWAWMAMPEVRDGPPYAMTRMIAAEPALAARIVARLAADGSAGRLAAALRETAAAGGPVVVTGCGTSEHGALAIAQILRGAWRAAGLPGAGPVAEQALELALDPPPAGLVIGVSHEGGTGATIAALEASRARGSATALITASAGAPAAAFGDMVLETVELDHSWCHTVGYVSPIVAGAAVAAPLARATADGDRLARRLAAGIEAAHATGSDGTRPDERIAAGLAGVSTLLAVASGADRPAARELVLKVEEASWLPAAMRDLETLLHGHLPATGPDTALVLLLADPAALEARVRRARQALESAREVGVRAAAILAAGAADGIPGELTPLGRIVVPDEDGLPGEVAALLGTAGPLQLVTERLARARGTNPDPIRRDDPRYLRAAEIAES